MRKGAADLLCLELTYLVEKGVGGGDDRDGDRAYFKW